MKKVNLLLKIFIFLFTSFFLWNTYASTWITIDELKEDIKILQIQKIKLYKEINDISSIDDIKNLLKDDLTSDDITALEWIILNYNSVKWAYNTQQLSFDDFMQAKKDFYKKVSLYIKSDNLSYFLSYIKDNLTSTKNYYDIVASLKSKQKLLDDKLYIIKEKIKNNKEDLQSSVDEIIKSKIDEKIDEIKNNDKFKSCDVSQKKNIITKIIEHVEKRKQQKIESNETTTINNIDIYDLVLAKLKEFLLELG